MKPLPIHLALALLLALLLAAAPTTRAAWPQNMRATFIGPAALYLPRERKIYVFGGRQLISDTVVVDLDEVAVVDLAAPIADLADPMSPAVSPAPFKLPTPDYYMTALAYAGGPGVYEVRLLAGLTAKSAPMKVWRVPDLLRATSVEVSPRPPSANASLAIMNPAWAASTAPFELTGGLATDPSSYLLGNWTNVTSTLWRFDQTGLSEVAVSSPDRPLPRAWTCLLRYDTNRLVLAGGNDGTNTQLADIWLFSILPRTWARYPHPMSVKRDDFQMAVYTAPSGARFLIILGYVPPLLEYVALDKGTPPVVPVIDKAAAAGLSAIAANALVVHDSHLFVIGGVPKHLMSAIKITPNGDELSFSWVPSYTPSYYKPPQSNGTSSAAAATPTPQGDAVPVAAIIGACIGGVVALAGLALAAVVFRRRTADHRRDRAQRDLLLHALIEERRASSHPGSNSEMDGGARTLVSVPGSRPGTTPSDAGGGGANPLLSPQPQPPLTAASSNDMSRLFLQWVHEQTRGMATAPSSVDGSATGPPPMTPTTAVNSEYGPPPQDVEVAAGQPPGAGREEGRAEVDSITLYLPTQTKLRDGQ
ncbi:hypothetical protein H9P43_009772 [Blastocladiella emersonii ATCC 22665]|nr:hypothetical protein H9P43_009772 [Blastocladiella emersonii ATCC 22665]